MKDIHMICNAHLDPVWLWQRQEGIAEAISTFRIAAKFCEEFDGFVFNHNESLLYEWVEEYEPELFCKIKKLVKDGKWKIMGGWYLQPDCMMPSGESFIRQIETGNKYFKEKFGVKPTTAINFDPFGHTRGLVQILSKCGYDSYIFMRPYDFVPEHDFIWEGYDGSKVCAHCTNGGYNTNKGKVQERIDKIVSAAHDGANLMLWGIGNHGGGPSLVDLNTIKAYNNPEVKMIHSWTEKYFAELDKTNLRTVNTSIVHCMVGCYTSMVRIKQMHRLLENELGICEKMLAVSGVEYDRDKMKEAEKALLFCEFHDVLPGSAIKAAEDDALRLMNYGREIIARNCQKAFFKLCEGQKEGKIGEIPILVFNPNPYEVEEAVEVEFQLEDQNWNDAETTIAKVRDEDGNYISSQNEKEASSERLDWRKKIAFQAKLKPMSMNRFDCELSLINSWLRPIEKCIEDESCFLLDNGDMKVSINKNTGLIDEYTVDGIDYLKKDSCRLLAYEDNEDPWGMTVDGYYNQTGAFETVSKEEANSFNGYPNVSFDNVRVIENGSVRTKIQAILKHKNSYEIITYTIPKKGKYVDIHIKMLSNDVNTLYKLSFNTCFNDFDFVGQTAFGREAMLKDEKEVCFQKWCGAFALDKGFAVINRGTYGGSAKDGIMNLTLLRTPVYSAHPILDRPVTDPDRSHDHIDMGEREFDFRITTNINNIDSEAEIFNQSVYALSFFPSGMGERKNTEIEIDNKSVVLSGCKTNEHGNILIRLFNTLDNENKTKIRVFANEYTVEFGRYEVKTFALETGVLKEVNMIQ